MANGAQVYPGVGWAVWRSPEYLPEELIFNINYLGADQASFTLNFSKGASQVIGQYCTHLPPPPTIILPRMFHPLACRAAR